MMFQVLSILLMITFGVLCSGTQQGVSSTQAGQTLQIQSNVRKYNKHTATEKPCATGSTTGTRKDKPESADAQDYVTIGGVANPGYPYPVQVVQGGRPVPQYYPYELQYPVEAAPPGSYYAPYYPATSPPAYYTATSSPPPPPYYPVPAPSYAASPYYHPAAYPAPSQQQLYEQQSTVVDAYRSPPAYLPPQADGQPPSQQYYRQPGATPYHHYPPYVRAHAYNRPAAAVPAFLQQRDASAAGNNAESAVQYEQQQPAGTGSFDGGNQFHYRRR